MVVVASRRCSEFADGHLKWLEIGGSLGSKEEFVVQFDGGLC